MKKETHNIPVDSNKNESVEITHQITCWQQHGRWEYEYNCAGYTGRYRCYQGRMSNGIHPAWDKNGVETPS